MQGITTVTLVVVVITGILTSVLGPVFLKMIGIKDPVAIGLSLGGTGHAVGTGTASDMVKLQVPWVVFQLL